MNQKWCSCCRNTMLKLCHDEGIRLYGFFMYLNLTLWFFGWIFFFFFGFLLGLEGGISAFFFLGGLSPSPANSRLILP